MQPQNPGYPQMPPGFVPPPITPAAPQGVPALPPGPMYGHPATQAQTPPWSPQVPQAPAPMLPPQGFTPPVTLPQQGAPGYAAPPVQAPPPAQYAAPQNPYEGSDAAKMKQSLVFIPKGISLLELVKYERANIRRGEFAFVKFRIVSNDLNPALAGTECTLMQNMRPNHQGGSDIAFSALKSLFIPLWGYNFSDPAHKAAIEAIEQAKLVSQWLFEVETRGTACGVPMAGRKVWCHCTTGRRTERTPVGKEPFDQYAWRPVPEQSIIGQR